MGKASKGSSFERELCKELSRWWSRGDREDIFWRTSQSGGRATMRRRRGLSTYGQQGDVQATDPVGAPLTQLATIEAKRGYRDCHVGDLADLNPKVLMRPRPLLEFLGQSARESKGEGTPFWILIVRRDKRVSLVYLPSELYLELLDVGSRLRCARPWVRLRWDHQEIYAVPLSEFTRLVSPDNVRAVHREFC